MKLASTSFCLTAILLATTPVHAAPKFSNAQCQSWFKANDRDGDGFLGTKENATKFLSRVTLANDERGEYIMTKAFFMVECKIGSFGRPPS
jgi:hypothetical protein